MHWNPYSLFGQNVLSSVSRLGGIEVCILHSSLSDKIPTIPSMNFYSKHILMEYPAIFTREGAQGYRIKVSTFNLFGVCPKVPGSFNRPQDVSLIAEGASCVNCFLPVVCNTSTPLALCYYTAVDRLLCG